MKKYILLLVLVINLMPYINQGKVKWTTVNAEAQYYTIEYFAGYYFCGSILNPDVFIISNVNCYSIKADEAPVDEGCTCADCGAPKYDCDQTCLVCQSNSTVNEIGEPYIPINGNACKCGWEIASSNGICTNPDYCPYRDGGGGGSNSTSQDCAPPSFSYELAITNVPIPSQTNTKPWCVFYLREVLCGGTTHASAYASNWLFEYNMDHPNSQTNSFQDSNDGKHSDSKNYFDATPELSVSGSVSDGCTLIQAMAPSNKGILIYREYTVSNIPISHIFLIYKVSRTLNQSFSNIMLNKYDSSDPYNNSYTSDYKMSALDLGICNYIVTKN